MTCLVLQKRVRDALTEKEQRRAAHERFAVANRLEAEYMRSMRYLTRQIDQIVKTMAPGGDLSNSAELQRVLRDYSKTITPWAKSVAEKMVARVARKESAAWFQLSREMGLSLRQEIEHAPVGQALTSFVKEQVKLIQSLPADAAQRVGELTVENLYHSKRSSEIAKQVMQTGKITEGRAKVIARTEIARVASGLTMVRAQAIGSTHYTWMTSDDPDVRPSHKVMNGQVIAWAEPPEVDPGKHYHAGQFVNCRCWPSPILSDRILGI